MSPCFIVFSLYVYVRCRLGWGELGFEGGVCFELGVLDNMVWLNLVNSYEYNIYDFVLVLVVYAVRTWLVTFFALFSFVNTVYIYICNI